MSLWRVTYTSFDQHCSIQVLADTSAKAIATARGNLLAIGRYSDEFSYIAVCLDLDAIAA